MRMTVVVDEKRIVGAVAVVVEYYCYDCYYDCCIGRHDYGVVAVDVIDRSYHCSAGGEEEGEEHGAVWKMCEFHH